MGKRYGITVYCMLHHGPLSVLLYRIAWQKCLLRRFYKELALQPERGIRVFIE
jgi:hypothetical protein